jgi:hypothetical protein
VNALDDLKQCPDVATLKSALQKVCEEFGKIARLDVVTTMHDGSKQAICFLRLDTSDKEAALMKALGVGRFGGEIVLVVNLKHCSAGKVAETDFSSFLTSSTSSPFSSASSSRWAEARGMNQAN